MDRAVEDRGRQPLAEQRTELHQVAAGERGHATPAQREESYRDFRPPMNWMDDSAMSIFFTLREGIRPSNSPSTQTHLTFICAHRALPMS